VIKTLSVPDEVGSIVAVHLYHPFGYGVILAEVIPPVVLTTVPVLKSKYAFVPLPNLADVPANLNLVLPAALTKQEIVREVPEVNVTFP
jgi:hypothetical protein